MKESTRKIILNTSKRLFNEKGVYNISLRQIATEVGISQGNLTYYYKKKEDLIKELYYQLVEILSAEFEATSKLGSNFYFLFELARKTFELQLEYKFLIVDLNYLVNDYPELDISKAEVQNQRIGSFKTLFNIFVEKGYMRTSEYEAEYDELSLRLYILGVYAVLFLANEPDKNVALRNYLNIILSACYPYLTKDGKDVYFRTLQDYTI